MRISGFRRSTRRRCRGSSWRRSVSAPPACIDSTPRPLDSARGRRNPDNRHVLRSVASAAARGARRRAGAGWPRRRPERRGAARDAYPRGDRHAAAPGPPLRAVLAARRRRGRAGRRRGRGPAVESGLRRARRGRTCSMRRGPTVCARRSATREAGRSTWPSCRERARRGGRGRRAAAARHRGGVIVAVLTPVVAGRQLRAGATTSRRGPDRRPGAQRARAGGRRRRSWRGAQGVGEPRSAAAGGGGGGGSGGLVVLGVLAVAAAPSR